MRIAVIKDSECQAPERCHYVCADVCPRVREGARETVYVKENGKAAITEDLCISCGICVKRCPYDAIRVINLPDEMMKDLTFQYGVNTFRTYNMVSPREKSILGLIGRNGIGKTTNINLIAGELKPNFGRFDDPPADKEIIKSFRGKEIQPYLTRLYRGELTVSKKPQEFELVGEVKDIVKKNRYGLLHPSILGRKAETLSGGEAQLVEIAAVLDEDADVYIFDEPMNYLDIKQRLAVSDVIRRLLSNNTVIVVEHDLVMLDYLTDYVQIMFGSDANYGIVSHVMQSRNGINSYVEGYLQTENVRFRDYKISISRKRTERTDSVLVDWPAFDATLGDFNLSVESSLLYEGDVVGVIGENGIGKTTFVKALAGLIETSVGRLDLGVKIGYKPQFIKRFDSLVEDAFSAVRPDYISNEQFYTIIKRLEIDKLLKKNVMNLSGGELQKVAIMSTIMSDAKVLLFDEPSANLDLEDRLQIMEILTNFVSVNKKSAIVIDHDIALLDAVSSRTILFGGEKGRRGVACGITGTDSAINDFMKRVDITIRRDQTTGRPRINQKGSRLDTEQRESQEFFKA